MKKVLLILFSAICVSPLAAQEEEYYAGKKDREERAKSEIIDERIELLAETSEAEDFDLTTVFDQLYYFLEHPINLNFTDKEELQQLLLLNEFQINNLLDHIDKNGKLMTIYEIQAIEGFDLETIYAILPFVKVNANFDSPHISMKELLKNGNHELFIRYTRVLEEMEGFSPISDSALAESPNSRYLGGPDKLYTRYRFKFGTNVSWGVTGEKDQGEEFFKGTQKQGFDFYSAHLFLKDIGKIKHLAIGDYQVQLGQGLTFWSGRAFNKSADAAITIKRNASTLRPYTSVDENLFMRGAAGTVELGKFDVTTFYSRNGRDANIVLVDTSEAGDGLLFASEVNSGLHATPNTYDDKNALTLSHYGSHVRYRGRKLEVGATGVFADYSLALASTNDSPYARFQTINQPQQFNAGIDFNYVIRNFNFFGEAATTVGYGSSALIGVIASLDPRLSISALYRNYGLKYYQLEVNPFGESRQNARNEKGLYVGMEAKLTKALKFTGYVDSYKNPWLKYQVNGPSHGMDYLAQLNWKPSKKLEMYIRYKDETKQQNDKAIDSDNTSGLFGDLDFSVFGISGGSGTANIKELVDVRTQNIRYNVRFKVSDAITIQNRIQYNTYRLGSNGIQDGFLIFQDISYSPLSKPYSFNARFALFDTDGWNGRVYAYENDVLYFFGVPAYYNRGSRWYFNARYKVKRFADVWLRLAQTYYSDTNTISSGLNQINGNTKTEIRVQVRFKL